MNQYFIVKVGGKCLQDDETFSSQVAFANMLGTYPIIVHGGRPQIDSLVKARGIPIRGRKNDQRVTDKATLECVVEALYSVNQKLVSDINQYGGSAQSVADQEVLYVRQMESELGFVGEPVGVNGKLLIDLIAMGKSPVMWCIGYDSMHQPHNVNGDRAVAALVRHMGPENFAMLTSVTSTGGVLDLNGCLIPTINYVDIDDLVKRDIVSGGMAEKLLQAKQLMKEVTARNSRFQIQIIGPSMPVYETLTNQRAGTRIIS